MAHRLFVTLTLFSVLVEKEEEQQHQQQQQQQQRQQQAAAATTTTTGKTTTAATTTATTGTTAATTTALHNTPLGIGVEQLHIRPLHTTDPSDSYHIKILATISCKFSKSFRYFTCVIRKNIENRDDC